MIDHEFDERTRKLPCKADTAPPSSPGRRTSPPPTTPSSTSCSAPASSCPNSHHQASPDQRCHLPRLPRVVLERLGDLLGVEMGRRVRNVREFAEALAAVIDNEDGEEDSDVDSDFSLSLSLCRWFSRGRLEGDGGDEDHPPGSTGNGTCGSVGGAGGGGGGSKTSRNKINSMMTQLARQRFFAVCIRVP